MAANKLFTVSISKRGVQWIERRLVTDLEEVLTKFVSKWSRYFTVYMRRLLSGPTSHDTVGTRSGKLRKSVAIIPTKKFGNSIVGGTSVGRNVPYAPVHIGMNREYSEIRPKDKRYLAIPLPAALTSKKGLLRAQFQKKSLSDVPGLFRPRYKRYLAMKNKDGTITPMFLLVNSFKVPVRIRLDKILPQYEAMVIPYARKAVEDYFKEQ